LHAAIAGHFGGDRPLEVLEVGSGPGLTLEYLCSKTAHSVYGMDFSIVMVEQAQERTASLNNRPPLLVGNALELPFADHSFDVLYATRFIHQFPHADKLAIVKQMTRVVRPGGMIALEFYARPYNVVRYYVDRKHPYPTASCSTDT
jgi:tocopherol O-methyltransferase